MPGPIVNVKEAKDYARQKGLPEVLERMAADVLYHRPEDPLVYLQEWLARRIQLQQQLQQQQHSASSGQQPLAPPQVQAGSPPPSTLAAAVGSTPESTSHTHVKPAES
jgi:hypothetical protein